MEDIIDTNEKTGLLSKKQEDLTVGDNLKIAGLVTGAMLAVPLVIGGVSAAVVTFAEWRQARRLAKEQMKNEAIETTSTEAV